MSERPDANRRRDLYMVLSPRALPYARLALTTLFAHSAEPFHLRLITDSPEDKELLFEAVFAMAQPDKVSTVYIAEQLDDEEAQRFAGLPNLRAFRHGHPCWRKITDPLLLSPRGDEIILLDPDLYFPNRFTFESTPTNGLLLMWQRPNCLYPPEIVQKALDAHVPLARHVDIGVSHWRGDLDLAWLDWLIGKLGGAALPRVMHVEAIVWSAIAMRAGGGHLDPNRWVCWRRTQSKRVRVKLGSAGKDILASEPWGQMKCFHAGGDAKWWLQEAVQARPATPQSQTESSPVRPFVPLTARRYACEQGAKRLVGHMGYYRLFGSGAS